GGPTPPPAKRGKPIATSASSTAAVAAPPSIDASTDPQEVLLSTSTSLFEYLERLPPRTLRSIYALPAPRGPTVVAAVIRSSCITDMARQCALRLVACGGAFKVKDIVEGWIHRHGRRDALLALRRLESMGILEPTLGLASRPGEDVEEEEEDGENKWAKLMGKDACLTPEFRESMKVYLSTSSSSPWPIITREQIDAYKKNGGDGKGSEKEKPSRDPPTRQELESYTQSSWDSVLHFLVGSDENDRKGPDGDKAGSIEEPTEAMVNFLTRIGLMQEDPDYTGLDRSRAPLVITSKGYEFMLRDINAQVWQFVLQYMNSMTHHEMKDAVRMEALSFLICLGSCRVGEGFHSSILGKSKSAKTVMKDFGRFGLLFVCRVAGKMAFYPTRVAVNLVASNEKAGSRQTDVIGQSVAATRSLEESLDAPVPSRTHLAVIVQTNFQLVCYTRSKLHVSTLGLFCDVQSYRRLPNVIFFHITRDSIRSAFRLGVTSDQILRFLHVHAHPMLRSGGQPLVPANVRDQILLWDKERTRVVMDEVWVHQCRDASEFASVGQYASDSDALAWGAAHTNKLYIHSRKSDQIQTYIRKWRTKGLKS
ncbi:hypothetical protein ACHAXR_011772, partial [Thalassiosira sp. AJA248-18]